MTSVFQLTQKCINNNDSDFLIIIPKLINPQQGIYWLHIQKKQLLSKNTIEFRK